MSFKSKLETSLLGKNEEIILKKNAFNILFQNI